ncbi:hypothetical protein ACHAXR_009957 [Thalassiosira sp. AJA248-18]
MDDRKAPPPPTAPPQAITEAEEDSKLPAVDMPPDASSKRRKSNEGSEAEEDSKLPAVAMPQDTPSKKRKINEGKVVPEEVVDVAAQLQFTPGDRIEVKWTINDDDDSEGEGGKENAPKDETDKEDESGKSVSVWWPATLSGRTERMHTLTEEEREESDYKSPGVKLPIYNLNYSPLEEYGFESHSLEEVAFISDRTLLNLSTDEIMIFRKLGTTSPPPSPIEEVAADESEITKGFNGQDEMAEFMNNLMQQCLEKTGMDRRMGSLPASEQLMMAERIKKAKDGMLEKLMEETDKMDEGGKVITAEVVRRCMAQMNGGY